jgi:hypothetical protein
MTTLTVVFPHSSLMFVKPSVRELRKVHKSLPHLKTTSSNGTNRDNDLWRGFTENKTKVRGDIRPGEVLATRNSRILDKRLSVGTGCNQFFIT